MSLLLRNARCGDGRFRKNPAVNASFLIPFTIDHFSELANIKPS